MAKIKKIKNKNSIQRHPALIVLCILIFLAAGLAVYWVLVRFVDQSSDDDTSTTTATETTAETTTTESTADGASSSDISEEVNNAAELSGYVSRAENVRGTLQVYVIIAQSLTSGTCTMILTDNSGEEATFTADIEMDVTTAMCNFEASVDALTSGTWQMEILLESGDRVGTITGSVEI